MEDIKNRIHDSNFKNSINIIKIKELDFVKNIKYAIPIENNNFLIVYNAKKMIIILFPENIDNYFTFFHDDFEFINYVKRLNNNNILICLINKFIIIKINYKEKIYNILGSYDINLSTPTLSEFYNENKFLLLNENKCIIFQYELKKNNYSIIKEAIIVENNKINYYHFCYSYHPKNNNKEFIVIDNDSIIYYNSITYEMKEKIEDLNNIFLSNNDTNIIEWKNNILLICQFRRICIFDSNTHKIIFQIENTSTSLYFFKTIQLLKNNSIIMGIFILYNGTVGSNLEILSLDNLKKEFFFNKFFYKKELPIKGTQNEMLNIVLSENKDYFILMSGMSRFFDPTISILKIEY